MEVEEIDTSGRKRKKIPPRNKSARRANNRPKGFQARSEERGSRLFSEEPYGNEERNKRGEQRHLGCLRRFPTFGPKVNTGVLMRGGGGSRWTYEGGVRDEDILQTGSRNRGKE